jgi:ribonuclease BN (tRNA processing enzyme)
VAAQLEGTQGQGVPLEVTVADAAVEAASSIAVGDGIEVTALGVPHGDVPSVAYRVRVDGRTIVFGADQNGGDGRFAEFAADADVLVMHLRPSPLAPDWIARLHARPATVGGVAHRAGARRQRHRQPPSPLVSSTHTSLSASWSTTKNRSRPGVHQGP